MEPAPAPFFSVVIPTRNRPALFNQALVSVLRQSFRDIEIVVVNDGSAEEFLPCYKVLEEHSDPRVRWYHQPRRPNGHGPSYSINTGAHAARGRYLCILDDDDSWAAVDHLARAWDVIRLADEPVDVYYSNQRAYLADGTALQKPMWLAVLAARLQASKAGTHGTHRVDAAFLLGCNGFPHLNCTIIRRDLYLGIGGMDEGIRYECEVDLYLRTLAAARHIVYNPAFVASHNIPDAIVKSSVSTAVTSLQKLLSQISVYHKNLARVPPVPVRNACQRNLSMLYKGLAEHFSNKNEFAVAATYARVGLACHWTLKWQLYCLYLSLRAASRQ